MNIHSIDKSKTPNSQLELHRDKHIVFFDGVCNFCNGIVDFLWKRDDHRTFYYSSLQSEFAQEFLSQFGQGAKDLDTVYFYANEKLFARSEAAVQILLQLKAPYRWLGKCIQVIPLRLRDSIYVLFARYRYSITGKRDSCRIATPNERDYFLS